MARRSAAALDPAKAREAAARYFRRLTTTAGVNLAQFEAQKAEQRAVRMIAGFMDDPNLPASFRKECALDIVRLARGPIAPWMHSGETIDPEATGPTGATVGAEMDAARLSADLHERLTDLTMRRVPPEQWPDDVREAASGMIAMFSAEEEAAG